MYFSKLTLLLDHHSHELLKRPISTQNTDKFNKNGREENETTAFPSAQKRHDKRFAKMLAGNPSEWNSTNVEKLGSIGRPYNKRSERMFEYFSESWSFLSALQPRKDFIRNPTNYWFENCNVILFFPRISIHLYSLKFVKWIFFKFSKKSSNIFFIRRVLGQSSSFYLPSTITVTPCFQDPMF